MPLYVNANKSHPPHWSETVDTCITPSVVCASQQGRKGQPNTFTPSPGSSSAEPAPFTLASGFIERTPSELSENQPLRFSSRPTSGSEQEPELTEDAIGHEPSERFRKSTNLHASSPLQSARQETPAAAANRMRSLNFLEKIPNTAQTFSTQYPSFSASSTTNLSILTPSNLPAQDRTAESQSHGFSKTRGPSKVNRPIQPIEGPPPPVLLKAKGPWHKGEDTALMYWVSHLGTGKWVEIAKRVGSRTGKQCRERWTNQLSPEIDHSAFRHEEDMIIISMQQTLQANKWCEVAKYLPGRPENAIKNRWNSRDLQRKRNEFRVNVDSGRNPEMLAQDSRAEEISNQSHSLYVAPKRLRSPSNPDYNQLGFSFQTPRSFSHGSKRHRVILEPHSADLRTNPRQFQTSSGTHANSNMNENPALHASNNKGNLRSGMPPMRSQENWSQDLAGYQATTPPNPSSSAARPQCAQRNQLTSSGIGNYYSTPMQSPSFLLDSSSVNSLISSESSDPRHPTRYPATSYDELSTSMAAPLVGPSYTQQFFLPSTPNTILNNMYYNSFNAPSNRSTNFGVEFDPAQVRPNCAGIVENSPGHLSTAQYDYRKVMMQGESGMKREGPNLDNFDHTPDAYFLSTNLANPADSSILQKLEGPSHQSGPEQASLRSPQGLFNKVIPQKDSAKGYEGNQQGGLGRIPEEDLCSGSNTQQENSCRPNGLYMF